MKKLKIFATVLLMCLLSCVTFFVTSCTTNELPPTDNRIEGTYKLIHVTTYLENENRKDYELGDQIPFDKDSTTGEYVYRTLTEDWFVVELKKDKTANWTYWFKGYEDNHIGTWQENENGNIELFLGSSTPETFTRNGKTLTMDLGSIVFTLSK